MDRKKLLIAFVVVALIIFAYMIVRNFTADDVSVRLKKEPISSEEYNAELDLLKDQLRRAREREAQETPEVLENSESLEDLSSQI